MTFTNASNVVEASGTLTTGGVDGGGFDVIALTGVVDDPTIGVDGPITNFAPGSGNDGVFEWDDIVYTSASGPHLDNLGLLFDAGGQEVNIYNSSVVFPGTFPLGDITAGSNDNFGGDAGTFNLQLLPSLESGR